MANNKLIEKLNSKTDKNFRITKIRVNVLDCLSDGHHGHTIKDIIDHLNSKGEKVNVSSIYNTINFLIDEGLVEISTNLDTKDQYFELVNNDDLHIHLHDTTSNKTISIPFPEDIYQSIDTHLKKEGYELETVKLEITAKKK